MFFKSAFGRNYDLASRRFKTTIDEIDKSFDHLQKTKDALIGTNRSLRLANDKAQDITIKKRLPEETRQWCRSSPSSKSLATKATTVDG